VSEVLVVGEALVDIVERRDGTHAEHPGGSPANVALGLGRLGRAACLLTRLGTDPRGQRVQEHLVASAVSLVPGSTDAPRTSTATARIDAAGVASYTFDLDWRLPDPLVVPEALALHTGSIAAFLTPGGDQVLRLVEKTVPHATISYDPNIRPVLMGEPEAARERVEHLVSLADVVKVSDEDLAWLAPGQEPEAVAESWLARGPAVVVVTRGGSGAVALTAGGRVDVRAPRIEVVDTVGAGDSFMAGLLDHLATADLLGEDRRARLHAIDTEQVAAMLSHAARIAAITCSRAGANPPTRAELDA